MPHINEKIDFTVEVFLVFNNKVLIRKHDKYDIFTGVGGHIEPDEDPVQAAIREVREETGLEITLIDYQQISHEPGDLIPPYAINRHRINDRHEHVGFFYCGKVKSDKVVQIVEERSDDISWLTKNEILQSDKLSNNIRTYALKALELCSE
jgi:8-oxo-dGTP pyrophosphatase MutT (NUDIX family)